MQRSKAELAVIPIAIVLIGILLYVGMRTVPAPPPAPIVAPDFSAFKDVKAKKAAFFEFMLPMIRRANDRIRTERATLQRIAANLKTEGQLSDEDLTRLNSLAIKYRVKNASSVGDKIKRLQKRIDTIPASLVLAQSANESAWGTARFARKGKNYFGLWCWQKNCGMIPGERDVGAKHEVASFDTIQAGVNYYLLTLNSHPAYESLRDIRQNTKQQSRPIRGWDLAAGLMSYSERGEAYVEEIRAMIDFNKLQRYSRGTPTPSGNDS